MKAFLQLLPKITLTLLIVLQSSSHAQEGTISDNVINDGPYVFIDDNTHITEIKKVCNNTKINQQHSAQNLSISISDCSGQAVGDYRQFENLNIGIEFNIEHPIAAISDFHGQYDLMKQILANNGIIDKNGRWSFGKGHLVITGDVFDRGDKVTEILWFLYFLEKQAINQGGMVHLLLGNHETMVLNDDLRYLHAKYVEVEKILGQSYSSLYADDTLLGRWLRSKNVLVKINEYLFAHGGFHPDLVTKDLSLKQLNQVFVSNLVKSELSTERSELATYVHKSNGPIWYRGYFKEPLATNQQIDSLLNYYGIKHIVVGHTSQTHIQSRYDGKVIAIDSSIKNGKYGEILLIEKNSMIRGTQKGNKLPISEL